MSKTPEQRGQVDEQTLDTVSPDDLGQVSGGAGTFKDMYDGAGNDGYKGSGRRKGRRGVH